ncbi:MAG: UDP-N-acetylmuramate--L-alanine ligase [Coriobacteriia bacterium]|nr:UDP-N-acetylmuramate--L-alanine ligase [Coriobacteriia bacterium]
MTQQELPETSDLDRPLTHVHFIGVGGAGMSALALVLLARGEVTVTGSDLKDSRYTRALREAGMDVSSGHAAQNITDPDIVVISTAITDNNPELLEAYRRGIPVWPRAQMLAWLCRGRRTIAVAGTHGKTSTSSMIAVLLTGLGLDPGFCIGGQITQFETNAHAGSGPDFVVEADESDRSFLYLSPQIVVLTNLEPDHMDHYADLDDIKATFAAFLDKVDPDGTVIVSGESAHALEVARCSGRRVLRYGAGPDDDYRILDISSADQGSTFELRYPDGGVQTARVALPGAHMVANAAAALALADQLGIDADRAADALSSFKGVHRRFDLVGVSTDGIKVVDDYGHHPTEIAATLTGAAHLGAERVVVVFQPHRYSRTQAFADDFGEAFTAADKVILTDVYSAGEAPIPGVSGRTILESLLTRHPHIDVAYLPHRSELAPYLEQSLRPGDLLITMGAGDVTLLGPLFLEHHEKELEARLRSGSGSSGGSGGEEAGAGEAEVAAVAVAACATADQARVAQP